MKKTLVFGGNWKASMTPIKCREYIDDFARRLNSQRGKARKLIESTNTRVILAPPSICLSQVRGMIEDREISEVVGLAVQDPWVRSGAYTGATTFEMVTDRLIDAEYALIGHSETREPMRIVQTTFEKTLSFVHSPEEVGSLSVTFRNMLAKEAGVSGKKEPRSFRIASNAVTTEMVKRSLQFGVTPILCVGETWEERKIGLAEMIVTNQVYNGIADLHREQIESVMVAYEPVWAIGTGQSATAKEARTMHQIIARVIKRLRGTDQNAPPIIYGGSMKPDNVAELVKQKFIDGGLIGGASLDPDTFLELILNGIQAVNRGGK